MAILFTNWWADLLSLFSLLLFLYYLHFRLFASKFWKKHNVPHFKPVFLVGNLLVEHFVENFGLVLVNVHRKWKDQKLVGFWSFRTPNVLITDLDLIKNILTRDFPYFRDRALFNDFDHDPLAGNPFNLSGEKWRRLRMKLTPAFTSGKMKMMLPTMMDCGVELQAYLKKDAQNGQEVEIMDILARYTTDVIASCAFGIEINSLKNPDVEFRRYGKRMTEFNLENFLRGVLVVVSPRLFKALKIPLVPRDAGDFFLNAIKDTMEYRKANNIKRNDFPQLLIDLQNKGKLDDVDWNIPKDLDDSNPLVEDFRFNVFEATAQAIVFYMAGFETTATSVAFALYELALNTDIQEALQEEIDRVLEKHGGKVTYEGISEMELLKRVVQETLRKYPPAPFIFRICGKDYEIPELKAKIPKGIGVLISNWGIHMDPHIYPNPQRFDPDRFTAEEKAKRHHFAYLPFGEGPRMCIGNRFALLQTKVGLISILSRYSVEVSNRTPIPIKFTKLPFVLSSQSGIPLKIVERNTDTYT